MSFLRRLTFVLAQCSIHSRAAVIHSYPLMYHLPVRYLSVLCCPLWCKKKSFSVRAEFYNPGVSPSAAVRFIVKFETDAETWDFAALDS